jgi:DNA polymerase I-like protein with 3'-5' exonuclease and polymerase domains
LLSNTELADWPRTESDGVLSLNKHDLRRKETTPLIGCLMNLGRIDKLISSFGPTLIAKVSPVTKRIHPACSLTGTITGRASFSKPNVQQLRKGSNYRNLVRAAKGYVLVVADYSLMELRAAAHQAVEEALLKAFAQGKDLHAETAMRMTGKTTYTDAERDIGKAINFGITYGMDVPGFIRAARKLRLEPSLDEAQQAVDGARRAYSTLTQKQKDHAAHCEREQRIVIGKDAHLGIGRITPFHKLESSSSSLWNGRRNSHFTQCCNHPVQGISRTLR